MRAELRAGSCERPSGMPVSKILQGVLLLADLSGGVTDVICVQGSMGTFLQSTLRAPSACLKVQVHCFVR